MKAEIQGWQNKEIQQTKLYVVAKASAWSFFMHSFIQRKYAAWELFINNFTVGAGKPNVKIYLLTDP